MAGLGCVIVAAAAACTIEVAPDPSCAPEDINTPEGYVTVRFRNLSVFEAVDVEFFATNESLGNLSEDLFNPANLVTANIGVAGTAIIQPWQVDVVEFPCSDALTLGTQGGRFVDDESGEFRGVGTPRWAQEGPLALCGSVVTFEYSGGDGVFSTALFIGQ